MVYLGNKVKNYPFIRSMMCYQKMSNMSIIWVEGRDWHHIKWYKSWSKTIKNKFYHTIGRLNKILVLPYFELVSILYSQQVVKLKCSQNNWLVLILNIVQHLSATRIYAAFDHWTKVDPIANIWIAVIFLETWKTF